MSNKDGMSYEQLRPILISRWNRLAEAAGPNWNGMIPLEREEMACLLEEFEWLRKIVMLNALSSARVN